MDNNTYYTKAEDIENPESQNIFYYTTYSNPITVSPDKTSFELLKGILSEVLVKATGWAQEATHVATTVPGAQGMAHVANDIMECVSQVKHEVRDLFPEMGQPKDWNSLFREVMCKIVTTKEQKLAQFEEIVKITSNFERTATIYGKIIISEVYLPTKFKTIKPVEFGGIAGGQKYLHNGILYKFATDWKGIYGSDEAAMKAASCEMRGLTATIEQSTKFFDMDFLCIPLMTLIDYQGFRLISQSVLPISNSTIVYGSSDAGMTVHASDPEVNSRMAKLGKELNLAPHVAGQRKETCQENFYFPSDIEVHRGMDGHYYMIDFARILPPNLHPTDPPTAYLFRQFRPEFILSYKEPLSSDAGSKFDLLDPAKEKHMKDVECATEFLLNHSVVELAKELEKSFVKSMSLDQLGSILHSGGVNFRYLGVLRKHISAPYLKDLLLLEMVAREVKNYIRHKLRIVKKKYAVLAMEPYHRVILKCFNILLGNSILPKKKNPHQCPKSLLWQKLRQCLEHHYLHFPSEENLHTELHSPEEKVVLSFKSNTCTFSATVIDYISQIWFECYTCQLINNEGICEICALQCHGGHQLSNPHFGKFFCDCPNCQKNSPALLTGDNEEIMLKAKLSNFGISTLFSRVSFLTGIHLSQVSTTQLQKNPQTFVFLAPDIERISCKSKRMAFVNRAEANALHLRSLSCGSSKERARLFPMARKRFEESLQISTKNILLQKEYAEALSEQALHDKIDHTLLHAAIEKYNQIGDIHLVCDLIKRLQNKVEREQGFLGSEEETIQFYHPIYNLVMKHLVIKRPEDLEFVSSYCHYLVALDLSHCTILTDDRLDCLAKGCPLLCSLNLTFSKTVRDSSIAKITQYCTKLTQIYLDGTLISDEAVKILSNTLHLQFLSFTACVGITNTVNENLKKMTNLRYLNLSLCPELTHLTCLSDLNSLLHLEFQKCRKLTKIEGLCDCTKLTFVNAVDCPGIHSELFSEMITKLTNLETLTISGEGIREDNLELFLKHKKLIELRMVGGVVSEEMKEKVKKMLLDNEKERKVV